MPANVPDEQVPVDGQSESFVQALPFLLQVPPMMEQSLTDWHVLPRTLQLPDAGQSAAPMQAFPVRLHAPACAGQLALLVQLDLLMLQVPGSGVQVGGPQVVVGVQGFSGSGGSRLQPGGL